MGHDLNVTLRRQQNQDEQNEESPEEEKGSKLYAALVTRSIDVEQGFIRALLLRCETFRLCHKLFTHVEQVEGGEAEAAKDEEGKDGGEGVLKILKTFP